GGAATTPTGGDAPAPSPTSGGDAPAPTGGDAPAPSPTSGGDAPAPTSGGDAPSPTSGGDAPAPTGGDAPAPSPTGGDAPAPSPTSGGDAPSPTSGGDAPSPTSGGDAPAPTPTSGGGGSPPPSGPVDPDVEANMTWAISMMKIQLMQCSGEADGAATQDSTTFGASLRTWVTNQSNATGGMISIDARLKQDRLNAGSDVTALNVAFEVFVTGVNSEWKSPRVKAQEAGHP
ncbi:hypothetical protein H0H93_016437, partial [Arthromyces matolae]